MFTYSASRFAKALVICKGDHVAAAGYAQSNDAWADGRAISAAIKGAVPGMEADDINGGGNRRSDLPESLRHASVIGRLPHTRRLPTQLPMLTATAASVASFISEGKARRMTVGTFSRDIGLTTKSVAGVIVGSNEFFADPSMDAEAALTADLQEACALAEDQALLDPTNGGSDSTPKAITADCTPITPLDATIAAFDAAVMEALEAIVAAGSNLAKCTWVMSPLCGATLGLARNAAGTLAYPGVSATGGQLVGLDILIGGNIAPAGSDGHSIVLVDSSQIVLVEDEPVIRTSQNAVIEMSDSPAGDTTTPTSAASLIPMFAAEATALLVSLKVNWSLRRAGCVQLIDGIATEFTAS